MSRARISMLGVESRRDLYAEFFSEMKGNDQLPDSWYQDGYWFRATVDGALAGIAMMFQESQRTGFFGACAVLPEFRGQGLQAKLIARRVKLARELGLTELQTHCEVSNIASLANLVRAGFVPVKSRHLKVRGENCVYLDMVAQLGRKAGR